MTERERIKKAMAVLGELEQEVAGRSETKYQVAVIIALTVLQEKLERENPQPLTLDELRGMDREPVWVVFHGDTCYDVKPCWMLVNCREQTLCTDVEFVDFSDIGEHFTVYAHRPEEGENVEG